jgi:hypothetical protein
MQANGKKTQTKIQSSPKKHFLFLSPQHIRKCHHPYNNYTHNRWIAHITHTHTLPKIQTKKDYQRMHNREETPHKGKQNKTTHTNLIMPSTRKANQNPMP